MIHRRLYCYAVLREFACSCKTRKPNMRIDTESHIGLFDACPRLQDSERRRQRAGEIGSAYGEPGNEVEGPMAVVILGPAGCC
ncbi:hypothetical protein CBM2598_U10072 [Cupriavidus taiwanensis]|uniref:Uncharacterized protein n=1 Tax=Cupriavidus taiwanensis TaxID=164546 RepID=A0A7Z7JHZ5_9BURK|nr:hypothetical protein CBM2597_U10278 [Cupriavidus taiwanensis]SOZ96251.1 hypothetical protein CBM2598_U10072 [Cupriavidus taiwanensis]SPC25783.1 hypothetical protein CBM2594_U10284 [Cupriavidus taiwanensis]